jgi:hypothetical protein
MVATMGSRRSGRFQQSSLPALPASELYRTVNSTVVLWLKLLALAVMVSV